MELEEAIERVRRFAFNCLTHEEAKANIEARELIIEMAKRAKENAANENGKLFEVIDKAGN